MGILLSEVRTNSPSSNSRSYVGAIQSYNIAPLRGVPQSIGEVEGALSEIRISAQRSTVPAPEEIRGGFTIFG